MNIKRIIIPLLLILFMASMAAFGAPTYGNVGPTTEFDYDIKILSEIVAEGTTPDGWETTVFFTDPTADRTITIPDADVVVGVVAGIVPPDHGGTGIANNVASTITITGAWSLGLTITANTSITLPTAGIVVSDNNACTDIEGVSLTIAGGTLNVVGLVIGTNIAACGANTDITSILNVGLYVGRDTDNRLNWTTDDNLEIWIGGVEHDIVDIETGAGDNDSLVTQGYVDDAVVGGGATVALDNLAVVQINTTLLSDAADTDSLGTAAAEWLDLFIGNAGKIYLGLGQTTTIHRSNANELTLTATSVIVAGALSMTTITLPIECIDSAQYVDGSIDHEHLDDDVIHGLGTMTPIVAADEIMVWDETAGALRKTTWTNVMVSISALGGMTGAIATATNISMTGELDMTGANALIDLNPAGTGGGAVICIVPTATLVAGSDWDGYCIDGDALDPLTGATTYIHGLHFDFSGVVSADGNDAVVGGAYILLPTGDTANSYAYTQGNTEMTVDAIHAGFATLGSTLTLSFTATYRGLWVDWDGITRDANAPLLEGIRVELPAVYTNFGANFAAYFSGGGETLTICDGTYALNVNGGVTIDGTVSLGANNITLTGYIGRDADNFLGFAVDDSLAIEIGNAAHAIVSISDGGADNDKLVTQGYCDDNAAAGGANVSLSNLAAVAINTTLLPDAADTWDLGAAADAEWLRLYLGTYGTVYFGVGQTESIAETAVNALLITATDGVSFSDEIWTTDTVGRDTDNYIGWGVDNSLAIKIGGVAYAIVDIAQGIGDNDSLCTEGYADDRAGGATIELDNLGVVAINTSLSSDAQDTDSLGSATKEWLNFYIGDAGKIFLGLGQDVELFRSAANTLTITASTGVLLTGPLGVTGTRVSKGWFAALESTADITINGTALAAIYANLGANTDITSILNVALYVGRDADNQIKFADDNTIVFRIAGVDGPAFISTGELDMDANTVGFTLQTGTGSDGTTTIDWRLGNKYKFTHDNQAETFTFTAPTNPCSLTLEILEDGNGAHDITWPGSVTWLGAEPTWTDGGANKTIVVVFWYNGTTYWGQGTPWES